MKGEIRNARARAVQGTRAGFVSQVLAGALDALAILGAYFGVLVLYALVHLLVTGEKFRMPQPDPWVSGLLAFVIGVMMLSSAWSGSGRAPGMAIAGLRVVGRDGEPLSPHRAFWRAVLAVLTLGVGLVTVLVSRHNASVYDMICGSATIYAWRPALPKTRQYQ